MLRHRRRAPHRPQVLELGLDAFDAAGGWRAPSAKCSVTSPSGASAGSKLMASSERTASLLLEVDALQLGAQHPLEAQRRAPAHVLLPCRCCRLQRVGPIEAVADGGKAPLARQVGDVADLAARHPAGAPRSPPGRRRRTRSASARPWRGAASDRAQAMQESCQPGVDRRVIANAPPAHNMNAVPANRRGLSVPAARWMAPVGSRSLAGLPDVYGAGAFAPRRLGEGWSVPCSWRAGRPEAARKATFSIGRGSP